MGDIYFVLFSLRALLIVFCASHVIHFMFFGFQIIMPEGLITINNGIAE